MRIADHTYQWSPAVGGQAPLLEVLEASHTAGFRRIGLDIATLDRHVAGGGDLDEIATALLRWDLTVTDMMFVLLTGDLDATLSAADRTGQMAEQFSAPWCLAAVPNAVDDRRVLEVARAVADRLHPRGVKLAIEFCSYAYLADLRTTAALCRQIGWDRAGIVIDALHFFRSGPDWDALAQLEPKQIAFVQLADAPAEPIASLPDESRNLRLLPGEGELALGRLMAAVRGTGFDGDVVAEVLSAELRGRPPLDVARRMHTALAATVDLNGRSS
jgi:sugar phosphate isomerase/epimerase